MFLTSKTGIRAASLLLIDVPNVSKGREPTTLNWDRLTRQILANGDFRNTDVVWAAAYAMTSARAHQVRNWIHTTFRNFADNLSYAADLSVWVKARSHKDVDSLIIGDMLLEVSRYEKQMRQRHGPLKAPLQVRIVLVSGDDDYVEYYQELQRLYAGEIEFELVVYGWNEHTGSEFPKTATRMHPLDDIVGFVKERKYAVP